MTAVMDALQTIPTCLGLDKAMQRMGVWLDKHPFVYKIMLIANHIFRIALMVAFMEILPFSYLSNFMIGLGISIFYRVTVERFCPFRFALLSCFGGAAYEISKPWLIRLINGTAIQSLKAFSYSLLGILPIALCSVAVILISHRSIEEKYRHSGSCCGGK